MGLEQGQTKFTTDSIALLITEGGNGWGDFLLKYNAEEPVKIRREDSFVNGFR